MAALMLDFLITREFSCFANVKQSGCKIDGKSGGAYGKV
jgi:hypothetical protein